MKTNKEFKEIIAGSIILGSIAIVCIYLFVNLSIYAYGVGESAAANMSDARIAGLVFGALMLYIAIPRKKDASILDNKPPKVIAILVLIQILRIVYIIGIFSFIFNILKMFG